MRVFSFARFCIFLFLSGCVSQPPASVAAERDVSDQEEVLIRAIFDFDRQMKTMDARIPGQALARAKGVVIFPSLTGRASGGTRTGNGVASIRPDATGKWGRPAFVQMRGGSFGIQETSLALLLMTDRETRKLYGKNFALGRAMAVAAGPLGRSAETRPLELLLRKHSILSYPLSKELFALTSFQGAAVVPDDEANINYYGRNISAKEILMLDKGKDPLPDQAKRFIRELNKIAPPPE